ncbi:MAG: hypothetical protein DMF97_20510, partial [Acidobacteria bacterium]
MAAAQTGSIAGVVKDTTGAVLPGVAVEASSPALIERTRTAITDDKGLLGRVGGAGRAGRAACITAAGAALKGCATVISSTYPKGCATRSQLAIALEE